MDVKLLHTADWHLGKKLHGFDMLHDQSYILEQILQLAKEEKVDAIMITGDIYDRAIASNEAIQLGNQTFRKWNIDEQFPLLMISGNHDSATRLATGKEWFAANHFHLNTTIKESLTPITLGDCQFYLLPYVELIEARFFVENEGLVEEAPNSFSQVLQIIIQEMQKTFDPSKKHIFIGHLFVAGSLRQESETPLEIGGLQSVASDLFDVFDYAAFGHLHSATANLKGKVRYSGSPLKYSVGEYRDPKGVRIINTDLLADDFEQATRFVPLQPLREVYHLEASFEDLLYQRGKLKEYANDYLSVSLSNEEVIMQLMNQLRPLYPYLLNVTRKERQRLASATKRIPLSKINQPEALIQDFFVRLYEEPLTEQQQNWIKDAMNQVSGKDES